MTLVLDEVMLRIDDGMKGTVRMMEDGLRIVYSLHGNLMIAGRKERWVPYNEPRAPMRTEECLEVALEADRALKAIVTHTPRAFWQPVDLKAEPFDKGLVDAILTYLSARLSKDV